jgi:hypothetical protein
MVGPIFLAVFSLAHRLVLLCPNYFSIPSARKVIIKFIPVIIKISIP